MVVVSRKMSSVTKVDISFYSKIDTDVLFNWYSSCYLISSWLK